jgi:hypothetical protein
MAGLHFSGVFDSRERNRLPISIESLKIARFVLQVRGAPSSSRGGTGAGELGAHGVRACDSQSLGRARVDRMEQCPDNPRTHVPALERSFSDNLMDFASP